MEATVLLHCFAAVRRQSFESRCESSRGSKAVLSGVRRRNESRHPDWRIGLFGSEEDLLTVSSGC